MINFCPPGTPITAPRALKNVLQSRRAYQSRARRFSYSRSIPASCPGTSDAPGDLLAREPAVRTGALIDYAQVSISAPPVALAATILSLAPAEAR